MNPWVEALFPVAAIVLAVLLIVGWVWLCATVDGWLGLVMYLGPVTILIYLYFVWRMM